MKDSSAPQPTCPVCGQERMAPADTSLARPQPEPVCPACGRHTEGVDPLRLAEEAIRRDAADGGWLVE